MDQRAVLTESCHQAARVHHEDTDHHQHCGESDAERDDQKQAEADAAHRERAQQHDQRGGTRDDAAADPQGKQRAQRHRPVVMAVPVRMAMSMRGMGAVRVIVRVARRGVVGVIVAIAVVTVMMVVAVIVVVPLILSRIATIEQSSDLRKFAIL
jgi:hypothetical protein